MYKRVFRILAIVFNSVGIGMIAMGSILYLAIGTKAGQLKDSLNRPVGMYVNSFLLLLLGGIGFIFLVTGMLMILIKTRKEKREKRLKEMGKVIYADIVSIQSSVEYNINRKHPYQVIAQYVDDDTKTIYQYHSEYILEYPFYAKEGEKVKIYVDPNNYKKYYMDLTGLISKNGYQVETL